MSLHDDKLDGARVVGEGTFRLDRRRAMDKLAHFQLEEPHQYVLELVAAAVCAGASGVEVRNDADDFEIAWDGDHPTREELDALFDWIFVREAAPRSRMLRHLAQGVFGALGVDPRWVRVERPGLTCDFTDPARVTATGNDRTEGVRVHVRERLGWAVLGDAVAGPRETRLLRSRAGVAPIPIRVGGEEISGGPSRRPRAPSGRPQVEADDHHLWLTTRRATRSELAAFPDRTGTVALIRDGILVAWVTPESGPLCLAGWVVAPDLKLNASLSAPVEDDAWNAVQKKLASTLSKQIGAALATPDHGFDMEALLLAALELFIRDEGRDLLWEAPLFVDLNGRRFKASDLREQVVYILGQQDLADPSDPAPQFPADLDTPLGMCLTMFQLVGGDERFQARKFGRLRREVLARRVEPLVHAEAFLEQAFRGDGMHGTVAIPLEDPGGDVLRVELRVDDLPVEAIHLQFAGPLDARVAADGLTANEEFTEVIRDQAFKDVVAGVEREALRLLETVAQRQPRNERVRRLLYSWMRRVSPSKSDRKQGRLEGAVPVGILEAPLFTDLSGRDWSLDDLRGGKSGNKKVLRTTIRHVGPGFRTFLETDGVLRLDGSAARALRRLLPRSLKDVREELTAREAGARRRAAGQHHAVLGERVLVRKEIEGAGFSGQVGLVDRPEAPCRLDVVHEGVLVCTLEVSDAPMSTVAALDLPGIQPQPDWEGVRDEDDLLEKVGPPLREALRALILARAAEAADPHRPLPGWLWPFLARSDPWPTSLAEVPMFPTVGGAVRSFAEIAAQEDVWWSPEEVEREGLEDVLVLDETRQRALRCLARRIRDASDLIAELTRARAGFIGRKMLGVGLPDSLRFCGRTPVYVEGLRGEAGVIDGSAARPGLEIAYRVLGRGLCTESLPFPAPVHVVLFGPSVKANPRLDGLDRSVDVGPLHAAARAAAREAVAATLTAPGEGTFAPMFALRAALDQESPDLVSDDVRAAARGAPLFRLLGGEQISLDQILAELAAGRVRAVPHQFADAAPPPGETRWLVADERVREVLTLAGAQAPPDGAGELERWQKGQARRRELPREPFVPLALEAAATVLYQAGTHRIFLALLSRRTDGMELAWHAEGRIVRTTGSPSPVALRAVVTAEDLRGDEAFENPVPEGLAKKLGREARALVPDFLLAAARALERLPDPEDPLPVRILWAEGVRAALVAWGAAHRDDLPAEWEEVPVFLVSTGERISLPHLFRGSKRRRLRVVGPTCRGHPLDPEPPVLVVEEDEVLQEALSRVFELQWSEKALAREDAAWQRREAPPTPERGRPPSDAVLSLPAPPGCEGHLAVFASGVSSVTLYVGWREIETVAASGPVPLSGHLSHDGLRADKWFRKAGGPEKKPILEALAAASENALAVLLRDPDLVAERALWLRILKRSFENREAILAAPEGGVADLPLFESGDHEPLTPRQVAANKRVRWVPPGPTARSLDPHRPFVRASRSEQELLADVLLGYDAGDEAEEETRVWERRRSPSAFRLPARAWLAQVEAEVGGLRLLLGLDRDLTSPGRLSVRCDGVPIEEEGFDPLGVHALVEVPEAQVGPHWHSTDLTDEQRKGIEAQIGTLLALAAPEIRDGWWLLRGLCGLLAQRVTVSDEGEVTAPQSVAAWLDAPLVEVPDGATSLRRVAARLRDDGAVVWGSEPVDGALVVLGTRANQTVLGALRLGSRVLPVRRWRRDLDRQRQQTRVAKAAEESRRAIEALHAVAATRANTLLAGLEGSADLLDEVRSTWSHPDDLWCAALHDPTGPECWLLAWRTIDARLVAAGRFDDAAEVAVRTAERLAGGGGVGT